MEYISPKVDTKHVAVKKWLRLIVNELVVMCIRVSVSVSIVGVAVSRCSVRRVVRVKVTVVPVWKIRFPQFLHMDSLQYQCTVCYFAQDNCME